MCAKIDLPNSKFKRISSPWHVIRVSLRPTGSEIVAVALMKDELAALTSNTTAIPAICLV